METILATQLELELPIEYTKLDSYKAANEDYMRCDKPKGVNIYLVYCSTNKRFFVSRFFKRETIETYKTFRVIK